MIICEIGSNKFDLRVSLSFRFAKQGEDIFLKSKTSRLTCLKALYSANNESAPHPIHAEANGKLDTTGSKVVTLYDVTKSRYQISTSIGATSSFAHLCKACITRKAGRLQ